MNLLKQMFIKGQLRPCGHNIKSRRCILEPPNNIKDFLVPNRWISDTKDKPPWREAASLIISAGPSMYNSAKDYESKPSSSDYKVLMVKRSHSSSFMASSYVFPGGVVEAADYSPTWWEVYKRLGVSRNELVHFSESITGLRPPIIKDSITLKSKNISSEERVLPPNIALRITALRETFEETGVLLLSNPAVEKVSGATTDNLSNRVDIKDWQDKVHRDPYQFVNLCIECSMCPDIWSLYEWSNWLTPIGWKKRYDTIFYLCCLPKKLDVLLDQGEVTVMKWSSPEDLLKSASDASISLPPPQLYELSRLVHLKPHQDLLKFARERESQGCDQWVPFTVSTNDGVVVFLPGDDQYPEDADEFAKMTFSDCSVEELRNKSKKLNRVEFVGQRCVLQCNITMPCGHLQPFQPRS